MSSDAGDYFDTIWTTFLASMKSVGTACTLASIGIYLHQRGFVVGNGKRTLALISQQVTIPLLFFTKILYCNQDWSPEPCPNVTDSLNNVWILAIWPLWVCTAGILVGYAVTKLVKVPAHQRNSILASIAFGNSTGLPITLLTVIHSNFGASSALGAVDPTLFLSVYLVMYPVLQWGIGGVLLAPPSNPTEETNHDSKTRGEFSAPLSNNAPLNLSLVTKSSGMSSLGDITDTNTAGGYETDNEMQMGIDSELSFKSSLRKSLHNEIDKTKKTLANTRKTITSNVINNNDMPETYQIAHRGLATTDASLYWSVHENLNRWGKPQFGNAPPGSGTFDGLGGNTEQIQSTLVKNTLLASDEDIGMYIGDSPEISTHENNTNDPLENKPLPTFTQDEEGIANETSALIGGTSTLVNESMRSSASRSSSSSSSQQSNSSQQLMATISKILSRCFQPPVIAALMGLLFASFPAIRGVLVDIDDRNGTAPLQWFFDGLYEGGRAAVPINMIILGCNLSASYMLHSPLATPTNNGEIKSSFQSRRDRSSSFGPNTILGVVIGKMVVMPLVGYASTLLLSTFYTVPHEIAGSLYLVLTIVFLCPTANNVMVMVELGGAGASAKESMARIIAYQYAIAPIMLSGTVTGAVLMSSAMATYYQ